MANVRAQQQLHSPSFTRRLYAKPAIAIARNFRALQSSALVASQAPIFIPIALILITICDYYEIAFTCDEYCEYACGDRTRVQSISLMRFFWISFVATTCFFSTDLRWPHWWRRPYGLIKCQPVRVCTLGVATIMMMISLRLTTHGTKCASFSQSNG